MTGWGRNINVECFVPSITSDWISINSKIFRNHIRIDICNLFTLFHITSALNYDFWILVQHVVNVSKFKANTKLKIAISRYLLAMDHEIFLVISPMHSNNIPCANGICHKSICCLTNEFRSRWIMHYIWYDCCVIIRALKWGQNLRSFWGHGGVIMMSGWVKLIKHSRISLNSFVLFTIGTICSHTVPSKNQCLQIFFAYY